VCPFDVAVLRDKLGLTTGCTSSSSGSDAVIAGKTARRGALGRFGADGVATDLAYSTPSTASGISSASAVFASASALRRRRAGVERERTRRRAGAELARYIARASSSSPVHLNTGRHRDSSQREREKIAQD
jgi:hypothetical protein